MLIKSILLICFHQSYSERVCSHRATPIMQQFVDRHNWKGFNLASLRGTWIWRSAEWNHSQQALRAALDCHHVATRISPLVCIGHWTEAEIYCFTQIFFKHLSELQNSLSIQTQIGVRRVHVSAWTNTEEMCISRGWKRHCYQVPPTVRTPVPLISSKKINIPNLHT